jgi:hypothetical protein
VQGGGGGGGRRSEEGGEEGEDAEIKLAKEHEAKANTLYAFDAEIKLAEEHEANANTLYAQELFTEAAEHYKAARDIVKSWKARDIVTSWKGPGAKGEGKDRAGDGEGGQGEGKDREGDGERDAVRSGFVDVLFRVQELHSMVTVVYCNTKNKPLQTSASPITV